METRDIIDQSVEEAVADELAGWRHDGLIDGATAAKLAERYGVPATYGTVLLRWLGFFALFLLALSLLGALGLALGPVGAWLAPFLLAGLAVVFWSQGVRLATDTGRSYPISGSVLLTAGLLALLGALFFAYALAGGEDFGRVMPTFMILVAAASAATAYRYGLRWPFALGLLLFFHAAGSRHGYAGGGTYLLGIEDPRVLVALALATAAAGRWQEAVLEPRHARWTGLGDVAVVVGLLYANLSLWILSLFPGGLGWVLTFTALAVAQVAAGSGLRDGRLTGFGIVFLAIDLYTRFYERFWDDLSRGAFFLVAGSAALLFAAWCEHRRRGGGA